MVKPEPTRRELESQKKKENIFLAAMELFKEYGYDNVTMKMIAKASGMSEGSIYHFFGEKAGILPMLTQVIQKNVHDLIEPTEERLQDPYTTILTYLTAQAREYEKLGRDLASVYLKTPYKLRNTRYENRSSLISTIGEIEPDLLHYIRAAMERGSITADRSAEELTFALVSIGAGLTSIWINYGEGYPLNDASQKIFSSALKAYL